jgi:hypothetical protein
MSEALVQAGPAPAAGTFIDPQNDSSSLVLGVPGGGGNVPGTA